MPTVRQIKEWALSLNEQNKVYSKKLLIKDSIIQEQDTLNKSYLNRIKSYERDSISYEVQKAAYRESIMVRDSVIQDKNKIIKLRTIQRNSLGLLTIIVIVLAIL